MTGKCMYCDKPVLDMVFDQYPYHEHCEIVERVEMLTKEGFVTPERLKELDAEARSRLDANRDDQDAQKLAEMTHALYVMQLRVQRVKDYFDEPVHSPLRDTEADEVRDVPAGVPSTAPIPWHMQAESARQASKSHVGWFRKILSRLGL